jgi:putative lipoic acid-binding regulatory protein
MKKEIKYPAEITFKSVFTHDPELFSLIAAVLADHGVDGNVTHKQSKKSSFISFTVTADFKSEEHLNDVCCSISAIRGFIMMI